MNDYSEPKEKQKEKQKDSEKIFDGIILHIYKDTVKLPRQKRGRFYFPALRKGE